MSEILIVGGGIAGQAVCEEVRERDDDVAITLLCGEPRLPYDRVVLSHLLSGEATEEELQLRPAEWYADRRVDVLTGARAARLAPGAGRCELEDGRLLTFGRAVLCTGSDPLVPPIPGTGLRRVHVFRGPEDCAAIAVAARRSRRAVVIGGGLLGLEAARGVAEHGCATTVVHLMDRLMERQLDARAAALLAPAMAQLGVEVLLERETTELLADPSEGVRGVRFADGTELPADLVVISIGIRPQVDLARAAGLAVERGIVVDDRMTTSHDAVLAVGECAQHRGVVHGIVAPIHEQAAVAAETLLGREAAYAGSVPSAKLKVMGVDLVSVGAAEGARELALADDGTGSYRKVVVDADGRAAGAVLLGDTRGHELLLEVVRTGEAVPDPVALLARAGEATAADLPDAAQVCNCNGVCKGEILTAIREGGLGSTQEVVSTTRAGAGCGSCKPLVGELLKLERGGAAEEPAYLCPCRRQTREDLAAVVHERGIDSVGDLTAACGAGRDCGACKPGLAYLVSQVRENRHREERHARFINDRVHANIQKDGTFSVVPRMRGGVTSPAELRRIADVAERHEVPLVKVTGGQRIDLLGVRKEQLPAIWEELGMPSGHAYAKAVRTVKTCVGSDHCRFGLGDAIGVGVELERLMEGLYTPHKVKLAVAGCPRNCSEAYVKDIGLVAVEGGWEVYVGGAAGSTVRKGDLLATLADSDEATRVALALLQHYREEAEYLERTYHWVERVGVEAVREVVLDPGRQAELVERYRIAKAAANPTRGSSVTTRCIPSSSPSSTPSRRPPSTPSWPEVARELGRRHGPDRARGRRSRAGGPQRGGRGPPRRRVPDIRRVARRRRRVPAPGRPPRRRHRRRTLRDVPAARLALRPHHRRGGAGTRPARRLRGGRAVRRALAASPGGRARRGRVTRTRTTCPYCGVGCGLIAEVGGGRLTGVAGDPLHPVNRGATCRKPLHLPEAVHAPDRARAPLVRDSRDERWRAASWEDALATVAGRLRGIMDEHGPDAVAFYVSGQLLTEDYYVVNKLAKGFLRTNNVDSNSRLCMSSAVAGHRASLGSDGPPASYADLDQADCLLLLGSNAAECHPIVWARIRRRQAQGARVIVVDPRRTPTAQAADLHLAVRPGSDLPLLNAMLGVIAGEGLVDEAFVARSTEGLDEALAVAAQWPPERAAAACGVEAEAIVEAARTFGRAPRAMALWSMGANQSTVGTLKNRALFNLCLVTGNVGRPGAGPLSLTGQPNAMGGRETGGLSTLLPGYRSVASPEDRLEIAALWALPDGGAGMSDRPGVAATELTAALESGAVRAVWVAGTNPVVSQPDAERFAAALERAELLVVQDAYHPTETAALAHVALPAAQWPEKDGVMTNSERRVSLVARALDPPGDALADWEIFARLARALGHGEAFGWPDAAAVFSEFAATTAGRPCDVSGLSHERLRREGPIQWPCPAEGPDGEGHPGTPRLYETGRFPTPGGRARFAATPHAEPADAPDEDFPLVLTTGRLPGQWHTMTRTGRSPDLLGDDTEPFVELHPDDAAAPGCATAGAPTSARGAAPRGWRCACATPCPEGSRSRRSTGARSISTRGRAR